VRLIVDASVWVDLLLGSLPARKTEAVVTADCFSPPHVDFEVGAALVRVGRRHREIGEAAVAALLEHFSTIPLLRQYHPADALTALQLLDNSTYADAWYLAMARRMDAPIATTDAGMHEAATIRGIRVLP
jgi:predicted nucleic acid-binding protein